MSTKLSSLSEDSDERPTVSIVIPVYNEEGIIAQSLAELREGLKQFPWTYEILISENGSREPMIDAATASPFVQLSMVPLLTLIAFYAPPGRRATWFALMASLMNLALVAGQLQTKYLNQLFTIQRGDYSELGVLLIVVLVMGLMIPVGAILLFGRRI